MKSLQSAQSQGRSRSDRPIMVLLDLLGRRWSLRILWELRNGACRFRTLQKLCGGISPTVLNKRLAEMREAEIVHLDQREGYTLTDEGRLLLHALASLNDWAHRWVDRQDHSAGNRS